VLNILPYICMKKKNKNFGTRGRKGKRKRGTNRK
jgi:hypothetical protein